MGNTIVNTMDEKKQKEMIYEFHLKNDREI